MTRNLFQLGNFVLSSGYETDWRINIESLAFEDIQTLAKLISDRTPMFGDVIGVPTGGTAIALALRRYTVALCPLVLLVDDVLTTGESMRKMRPTRPHIGYVIFDRSLSNRPDWIGALWTLAGTEDFKDRFYGGEHVVV